ncbi:MAG: peptide chain release factor N(5)-glutamine methyltransferase [Clostridia bacterium]|nr:peptide chain release factor N(5)-glutamine methyltransferase [Clostridia bacterium]
MTYRDVCARLQSAGIENAEAEAGILLAHFCGVSASQLLFRKGEDFQSDELSAAIERRVKREPLQYLLGEWEFFGIPFNVSPDCLIPRPDTELLVESAIARVPQGAHFADFCTGSGCIGAAVLAHRPDTTAVLVDVFENTLALAKQNCIKNGVQDRADWVLCDLLQPLDGAFAPKFDAILSNPPYIPTEVVKGLAPELAHEPQAALDGGEDGMCFYRHFLMQTEHVLNEGGFWLFEIGYDQKDAIIALAGQLGFACEVTCDLGGNPRVAYVTRPE